ncbi:hypothetical protein [Campylobacter pinnipediorum]|uniref:hypothetical protein n=1 Tax=Campylobacter pinnipediorum TaxID=1965231 RepID=UPI001D058794|nr:hypothetical protein [Campylobacter pinnipediorum]
MPSKYGVNVELYNGSLNPYEINNQRPIAIVGDDSTLAAGLYVYSSVNDAIAKVERGSVKNALDDLKACGIHTQVVLNVFAPSTEEDEETKKTSKFNILHKRSR